MNKISLYLFISIILFSCSSSTDPNDSSDNYNRGLLLENITGNIILPRHENLQEKLELLQNLANNFTTDQNSNTLQQLRNGYEQTYIAWQYVEMFNLDKAEEIDYIQSMNTYPCNTTQININIDSQNYNLNDANYISWASQGLPSLDYMLYGIEDDTNMVLNVYNSNQSTKYLNYMNDIIHQMILKTNDVCNYWQGNYSNFIQDDGNTATSSLNKLTNDFIYYYEKGLRANKIGIPCGKWNNYNIYPVGVEAYYKKHLSKKLALASLKGCKQFFSGEKFINETVETGIFAESYVNYLDYATDNNGLSNEIITTFNNAETKINNLNNNFVLQLESNNNLMLEAYDALQDGVALLKTEMLAAFKITVDYEDSDGD
tara:strand:+ start:10109 stop:11227 length:1119 start_codon:yes stop_codon:yes gene_type:complete